MSSSSRLSRPRAALFLFAFVALVTVALPQPAAAQIQCAGWEADKTPADPPPAGLWNALEPAYSEGSLPTCQQPNCASRDSTWFNRAQTPWFGVPYWQSMEIQDGYAFTATNFGFQIWNLNGGKAENPDRLNYTDIRSFAPIITQQAHEYFQARDMSASDDGELAAITGGYSIGMLIVDTSNKGQPQVLYQDPGNQSPGVPHGRSGGRNVHVQKINGRYYGFLAAEANESNVRGLWAYDLTRAQELNVPGGCVDHQPTNPNPSCGTGPGAVFKGRLSSLRTGHVDGAGDDLSGHFLVASAGPSAVNQYWGFKIWNVSNPSAATEVLSGLTNNIRVDGVALWQEGAKFFLGLVNRGANGSGPHRGEIYDVTCIKSGNCGALSSLLVYDFPLPGFELSLELDGVVQDSVDGGGAPWVYFGRRGNLGAQGLQMEWLFNVAGISAANAPSEITGGDPRSGNQGQPTMTVGSPPLTVGYWSYMYYCHPSGSNYYIANGGQVHGDHFYRAGESIFDIHRLRSVNPQISVSGPAQGYLNQNLTFSANATNCSPSANGWSWDVDGGQIQGSPSGSSISVQWSSLGLKTVGATNSDPSCSGANVIEAVVQIDDPQPAIGAVTATPTTAPVCTPISFEATGVTGQPPLAYDWTVEQGGVPVPGAGGSTNPFVWDTTGASPGSYSGEVEVSGPGGMAQGSSPTVTLTALDPLPANGFTLPDPTISFGTVQFDISNETALDGATEWRWDFDGSPTQPGAFEITTTDPALGEMPSHSYTAIGTYNVWLEVRNCVETGWVRSARKEVTINEISPLLINDFRAQCPFGVCSFDTGAPITFFHDVEGNPDAYEYDWTNDGNDPFQAEETSAAPITTHTYTQDGSFRPILRVRRGAETVSFTHAAVITISTGPPPSISISGPATRDVGQSGTYTATASNCTPAANGWTWTTSGGTGTSSTSSINVSWSSSGTKLVSASNSACGAASGSLSVIVSAGGPPPPPPPPPGELNADFTFDPLEPAAGEEVAFDASPSAGNPTGWLWEFGDGAAGSGEQVTHAYSQPGNYSARLTISKTEAGCGQFGQNVCTDTVTKTVVVSGESGLCVPDNNTICLLDGRFEVTARWRDQRSGNEGNARVYTPFSSNQTGMFWFFRPDNVELIVKSIDGSLVNDNFWFFYGGLSNVEYWITVTDTETEAMNEYHNEPGSICGFPDTEAFPIDGGGGGASTAAALSGQGSAAIESQSAGMSGTCVPEGDNICLLDGRFSLRVDWRDQRTEDTGIGTPIVGTDRTGYFWFFNPSNIELVAKMIDASEPFGYFWVLWGGLSDVEYTLTVTDTVTGLDKVYQNPPGSFCGGGDTTAFDGV